MKMNKKYYITTPIYYPSADFHIGHCYTTIVADAIARYKRLKGYDVFFQTGTDEHGQKIEKKAEAAGVTPIEYINPIVENAKDLWSKLGISYDYFIRTTDEEHVKAVQAIFKEMYENKVPETLRNNPDYHRYVDANMEPLANIKALLDEMVAQITE